MLPISSYNRTEWTTIPRCEFVFSMRPKPLSIKVFILPVLIIGLFCVAAIFDYTRQHRHVSILGQSIDISSVQQILVEPIGASSTSTQKRIILTNRSTILKASQLLGTAKVYTGSESDFATDIDTMLIQMGSRTIRVPIAKANHQVTLLFFNGKAYVMPNHFLEKLRQFEASSAQSGS